MPCSKLNYEAGHKNMYQQSKKNSNVKMFYFSSLLFGDKNRI